MGKPRRPATEAEAKALASGTRLRIIRLCLDRPLTNKEIAERLGANPATTLHHVRTLVATGFLVAQGERRGTRGARELPYLSTGKSWTLDIHETGDASGPKQAMLDAFLDELRLVDLRTNAARFARLGLRLDADGWDELEQRLGALLDEYAAAKPTEDGRPYSIFVALYEDVSRG
jgi:DNA-binding transcriptional ArsR family regulator